MGTVPVWVWLPGGVDYLNLGDRLRIWARESDDLPGQLREVWRRMAFNALVADVQAAFAYGEWMAERCASA